VAVDRTLEEALDAVATSAHGKPHAGADKKLRDIRLKRRRETQFGLALMVRTIAVLIAYHRDDRFTSSRVSLSSIDAEELAAEGMKDKLPLLVKNATSILQSIAEVLQSELGCDDFRMLPDTSTLLPVIVVLERFKPYFTDQSLLSRVLLRLYLADLSRDELMECCEQ